MTQLKVNIVRGGLGRQSANVDTWGGLYVTVDSLPEGWGDNEVKRIFKPEDLETYGISSESTNSFLKLVYWHVSEAFRLAPNSTLYLQLGDDSEDHDDPAVIISAFHNFENRLRLLGFVFSKTPLTEVDVATLNTQLDLLFTSSIQPVRVVASYKKGALDAIPDFSAGNNYRVMVDISNDITAGGIALSIYNDPVVGMCGAAGTMLGQLLLLSVHQKPSWRTYPVNGGGRWELLGDINKVSVENKTQTELDAYATQGLNLISRTLRLPDAFISNSRVAGDTSDDYAIITHGRVIDKAISLAYDGLVKHLDGPVYASVNGLIEPETVELLQRAAYNEINGNMVIGRVGNQVEVSIDTATGSLPLSAVYINPNQDVLQTEILNVDIRITPVGASKEIIINIGLQLPQ